MVSRRLYDLTGTPIGLPLHSAPVSRGEFSPDGRWLVTLDRKLRIWDVSPDARPAEDLTLIASLLAGRSIDERGIVRRLTSEQHAALLRDVGGRHPSELKARPVGSAASNAATTSAGLEFRPPGALPSFNVGRGDGR
jgi:hypothetical protein